MLTGIGIIIILKQIPHAFGYDSEYEGNLSFTSGEGHNTFSQIYFMLEAISPGAANHHRGFNDNPNLVGTVIYETNQDLPDHSRSPNCGCCGNTFEHDVSKYAQLCIASGSNGGNSGG